MLQIWFSKEFSCSKQLSLKHVFVYMVLGTKSITKKQVNKCKAEIMGCAEFRPNACTKSKFHTYLNTLKHLENFVGKGEIAQDEQFHLFPQYFLCNLYLKVLKVVTFQLSSAASLNLGQFQIGILGNGLREFSLT